MAKLGELPFYFEGGAEGIVLVHGYTGAPGEMRLLGEFLHKAGYTVQGVLLPGHAQTPALLAETTWHDWYQAVQEGVRNLQKHCQKVYIAGLSLGGLLTIKAAAELGVDKAVIMSAPIFVYDRRQPYLPLLRYFIHYIPKHKRQYDVPDDYSVYYDVMPVKPMGGIFELIKLCRKEYLPYVTCPCLIMQSKIEHTVRWQSAQAIYDGLTASKSKELVWYNESGHILTLDKEREAVFAKILSFLTEK